MSMKKDSKDFLDEMNLFNLSAAKLLLFTTFTALAIGADFSGANLMRTDLEFSGATFRNATLGLAKHTAQHAGGIALHIR